MVNRNSNSLYINTTPRHLCFGVNIADDGVYKNECFYLFELDFVYAII